MGQHRILHHLDHEGKQRVLLIFDELELKYSIGNDAYIHGEAARVHDNYGHDLLDNSKEQAMHQWKDVCEDGNYDHVRDVIEQAIAEMDRMLLKYTAHRQSYSQSVDNHRHEESEWVIEMRTPRNFSDTIAWELINYGHEYIKSRVLEDWAGMTFVEAQPVWAAKRQEAEARIRHAVRENGTVHVIKPSII